MKRKFQSITNKCWSLAAIVVILVLWQAVSAGGLVPGYMLPSPVEVVQAFISEFPLLMENAKVTLAEAFLGLLCGVALGFVMAVVMDRFDRLYQAFYPLIVVTQTIPTVAVAPLLVLRSMGAGRVQIFRYIKLPQAMGQFFSSLRISASYSVVGAVISEWLGGFNGLGVYMTRVKKAFAFDKMFAVILLISVISLVLMKLVELAQRKCMAWEQTEKGEDR